ncbi:MAG: Bax inhibitor-1/YccA family protein [Magnetococcales bacterium]|nr:Bax inhibitor-1/YccA family protein [Magnetococcales bacterium]
MLNDPKYPNRATQDSPWGTIQAGLNAESNVVTYLKQVYALLASSLIVAVGSGYVGMSLPFAREHPIILMLLMFGALFLAFKVQNAATLFLFTGLSGLSLGPVIAHYVGAGMSGVVGQAAFMTGAVFTGLTFYSLTTKRDLSMMSGMLFAGLIVVVVGGLINLFLHSTAVSFAISAAGCVIFSGYILYETQQLKAQPWAVAPSVAALSMYLNVVNLFTSLLRLLGILGGDD